MESPFQTPPPSPAPPSNRWEFLSEKYPLATQVLERCDIAARYTDIPGEIARMFLTPSMYQLQRVMREWMREAGLSVRTDAIGNLIGRREAKDPDAPVLLMGSHLDSVPNSGRYDGVLGILMGIAAIKKLGDAELPFHIDVLAFQEEQGVRYQLPYLGSAAISGQFETEWLDVMDESGITMANAIRRYGLDPDIVSTAAYDKAKVLGYVEPHIEQGSQLEARGIPLGLVETIAGQSRISLTFHGTPGHAGTQAMVDRRDALTGAAEFIIWVEDYSRKNEGVRATVGMIHVDEGAANVVPGLVTVSLDVRHPEDGRREEAVRDLLREADRLGQARGLEVEIKRHESSPSVPMDEDLNSLLADAISASGLEVCRLSSWAGHDAVMLAPFCPVALLFLCSPGGLSHHPDEMVDPMAVPVGLDALEGFVLRLADRHRGG